MRANGLLFTERNIPTDTLRKNTFWYVHLHTQFTDFRHHNPSDLGKRNINTK